MTEPKGWRQLVSKFKRAVGMKTIKHSKSRHAKVNLKDIKWSIGEGGISKMKGNKFFSVQYW